MSVGGQVLYASRHFLAPDGAELESIGAPFGSVWGEATTGVTWNANRGNPGVLEAGAQVGGTVHDGFDVRAFWGLLLRGQLGFQVWNDSSFIFLEFRLALQRAESIDRRYTGMLAMIAPVDDAWFLASTIGLGVHVGP
jgi:hypothetical protein